MGFYLHEISRFLPLLAVAAILSTRYVKGKAQESAGGVAFPMKALVLALYAMVILVFGWIAYTHLGTATYRAQLLLLVVLVALILTRLPGTITLTSTGLEQRFWLLADKSIGYPEVMVVQEMGSRGGIKVMGDNRVTIIHSSYHVDAERFRAEIAARTGKKTS